MDMLIFHVVAPLLEPCLYAVINAFDHVFNLDASWLATSLFAGNNSNLSICRTMTCEGLRFVI